MSDVVNFALPVSVDGKHYEGFTVHNGVVLDLADAACVPESYKVITFSNAKKAPQNVPYGIGQFEVSAKATAGYFQVKPL